MLHRIIQAIPFFERKFYLHRFLTLTFYYYAFKNQNNSILIFLFLENFKLI